MVLQLLLITNPLESCGQTGFNVRVCFLFFSWSKQIFSSTFVNCGPAKMFLMVKRRLSLCYPTHSSDIERIQGIVVTCREQAGNYCNSVFLCCCRLSCHPFFWNAFYWFTPQFIGCKKIKKKKKSLITTQSQRFDLNLMTYNYRISPPVTLRIHVYNSVHVWSWTY